MSEVRREHELDCGNHSCRFARNKTGMRTNGPCTCVQQLIDSRNALAARLAECEQVKAEAIAHAAGLSSDLTGMGERLAEVERERDAYKSRLETRWQQADGKIEVELTRWDNLTQQLAEAQATVARLREFVEWAESCDGPAEVQYKAGKTLRETGA